jgi:hypothetical protein
MGWNLDSDGWTSDRTCQGRFLLVSFRPLLHVDQADIRLLSSFGLETIVESANEASLPLTDGPVWQPPGLDNLILGDQPINPPPSMPDFTTMGMGEFLDWSQRTGRTGQYEAYTANPAQGSTGQYEGYTTNPGQGSSSDLLDERRGRQWP